MPAKAQRAIVFAFLAFSFVTFAAAQTDPAVPPGRNPGGWPIALINNGIDYTDERIAARIARDGEGEIIGFDFADDDRRPFSKLLLPDAEKTAIDLVLAEGQASTLVPIRVDFGEPKTVARAMDYASQSPAKVVLIMQPNRTDGDVDLLNTAAKRYPDLLIITPVFAGIKQADNLIMVVATKPDTDGKEMPGTSADIATPALHDISDVVAAGRIAALAIRLQASHPQLSGVEMKREILNLAETAKSDPKTDKKPATIDRPERPFWLE